MKKYILVVFDESKTLLLGSSLAKICIKSCVIYLNGEIGTGKTIFCKGFLKALGYVDYVKSPTYTLVESYFIFDRYIYHIDCYRLHSKEELLCMDIIDNVDEKSIFLIEWPPSQEINILPDPDIVITINYGDCESCRQITIEPITNFGTVIVHNLFSTKKFKYEIKM